MLCVQVLRMQRKLTHNDDIAQKEVCMKISEFTQKVRDAVAEQLGEEYRVELREVKKNNGVILQGLLIISSEENVIPTIYLEPFHAAYEDGVPMGEITDRILDIYREETPKGNINMDFFSSFQRVKERICYKLIRRQENEELLNDIPYVEFLDLAVCFYYAYSGTILGEGTILIHNSHMKLWNVSTQELMKLAIENTPRLFPAKLAPMAEVLREIMDVGGISDFEPEIPLKVLTNNRRTHGAVCILYPGMLEKIAEKTGKNYYIIPSSVHEVILLEETGEEKAEDLKKIIREVNRTHVSAEEVLSDNLYFYDNFVKTVKIIF